MYKLDLPVDYKEAAARERRRLQEEQRKSRIFDSKTRLIGIDKQALEQQIRDRKQMEAMEKKREEAFASDAKRYDMIAELLERRQEQDMRELNAALNEFRMLHQQPSSRREWDLYDPDRLKKDRPARVSDDDPRCGVSGLQKFEGEDLNNKARTKFQEEQRRRWAEQQMKERKQAEDNQKRADYLYQLKMKEMGQRAAELEQAEEECRRAILQSNKDYNAALAREQETKSALKRQQDEDDKRTEIANHLYGDFLTENPAAAQSAFGSHRVVPDRWKGMTPEQIAEIRRQQDIQRKEAERAKQEAKRLEDEHDRIRSAQARAAMLLEQEHERRQKDIEKQLYDENHRLAREQKAHQDFLNNDVYTNKPTAAYFMQWNTTTR